MKLSKQVLVLMVCTVCLILFSLADASGMDYEYAIVISANASDTEIYAARVLSGYLSALDGNDYPIINDDQPFDGFKFCIGATSAFDTSDIINKTADSYIIAPFNNGLAIYGSGSRGTVYGVITFLEDFCGYSVYTAESGMVSTSGKIVIPKEKTEYNTYFEYRDTDWRSGWNPLYSLMNKLNGDLNGGVTYEQGGNISYLGASCHTLSTVFCSSDKYFESHPEYFALHDGVRVPDQLCLTNDSVYHIVLDEVFRLLQYEHDPEADLQIISLSQADNPIYCECDSCKALDSANGSHAGTMITFVNRIARAVKEEGYDNVEFDTFAYMYTRKAPSAVVPEDNVIVRLCTFECCFSHPMDDADCPENAELMNDLEEWSGICNKMYIWDYTTNYAYTLGIFPDFNVLQRNLQCFYEHGIRGVYEEGNYYVYLCDTEFGDLRTYLIAKLLENPYCDYEAAMLDFCNYYYGEGGEYIKTIIDEINAHTKDHVTIYSSMTDSFLIDEEEAEKIDQLWEMAENAAKNSETLAAIERSKLSWRYVKAALGLREFSGTLEENREERETLYNDLISHGVVMIDEWTWIEDDFAEYELIPVEEWEYAAYYYYLQYDLNGGENGPPNQWCYTGENWIPNIIPTREGYRFLGWATEKNAVVAEFYPDGLINLSSDMILYAVWEIPPALVGADFSMLIGDIRDWRDFVTLIHDEAQNFTMVASVSGDAVRLDKKTHQITAVATGSAILTVYVKEYPTASCSMTICVEDLSSMIRLPAALREIEEKAFENSGVTALMIPSGCQSIGERAFADNRKLVFAFVPTTVTSIAEDAFAGCPGLVIYCYEGSTAHNYAMEKGIHFKLITNGW